MSSANEVGQGTHALVGVLDPLAARAGLGRQRLMGASAGLDRGLLVGADDELAGVQEPAFPSALVEVEHRARLLQEVGIGREHPGAMLPRLDRVLRQPARDG
jgi:hypothetical protein